MNCHKSIKDNIGVPSRFVGIIPHIAVVVANIFWGSSFIFTKLILISLSPVAITICRFSLASIFLYTYIKLIKKDDIKITIHGIWSVVLLGFWGIALYFYMENTSLLYMSVTTTSLIIALIPVITFLVSIIVLKEKFRFVNIIGVVIAFWGASFIILKENGFSELSDLNTGYIFAFLATLSFSAYAVLGKKVVMEYSPIQTTFLTFSVGSILSIPFLLIENSSIIATRPSMSIVYNIFYLTIFCSIFSYFLWNWGLERIGPGKATIYMNLIPLTAVGLGWFILGEDITKKVILGGGLILAGIYMTNKK